jgi:anti-sigma factor RsiW
VSAEQFECIDPELGELLAAHAQGQLAAGDRPLFVAHLQACVRCAEEERVMREVALGIASLRSRPDPAAALPVVVAARSPARSLLVVN